MLMLIIANNHMELPNSHHHILKSCIHQHQCKSKHNQIKKRNLQKCHMLVCTPTMTKYEHDHNVTSIQYTKERAKPQSSIDHRHRIQKRAKPQSYTSHICIDHKHKVWKRARPQSYTSCEKYPLIQLEEGKTSGSSGMLTLICF